MNLLFFEFDRIGLPDRKGAYAVFGSGPIAARGWRVPHDLDVIVSKQVWDDLVKSGYEPGRAPGGSPRILIDTPSGEIEIFTEWTHNMDPSGILERAERIGGRWYGSLEDVLEWKKRRNAPKDGPDIKMIEDHLTRHRGDWVGAYLSR